MIIHDELNSFPNIVTVRINIINDEQYYNDGTTNRVKLHYVRTLRVEDVQKPGIQLWQTLLLSKYVSSTIQVKSEKKSSYLTLYLRNIVSVNVVMIIANPRRQDDRNFAEILTL